MSVGGKVKDMIKSWLNIQAPNNESFSVVTKFDFDANAIKNRMWYRGDPYELQQFYKQADLNDASFWSMVPSQCDVRKVHTGLPSLIIDVLSNIVKRDLNAIKVEKYRDWDFISKDNKLFEVIKKAISETLYIGDGAFKISVDKNVSEYPIIEYVPGDYVEFVYKRGRFIETVFRNVYKYNNKTYVHYEHYGFGYIKNYLKEAGKDECLPLNTIPQTANIIDVAFGGYKEDKSGNVIEKGTFNMSVPLKFFDSAKYENRGRSVFDSKLSNFDAFDEIVSQWIDAVRAGRSNTYIPDSMIPHNKETGTILKPDPFKNKFISVKGTLSENETNKIDVVQPAIPTDNYLQSYITVLDLCLQGLISPSTLGIDTKKMDNAEAQREKEKATLYTRGIIVESLENTLPILVNAVIKTHEVMQEQDISDEYEVEIKFGEYANPSFEAVVETMAKAKTAGIVSIEKIVDELYGDSLSEEAKDEEIKRLKEEQGISELDEPTVEEVEDIDTFS